MVVPLVFVPGLILYLSIVLPFQDRYHVGPMINRDANALSHSKVDAGARGDMLNNDTGLPPKTIEQADTLPGAVTGAPIAASYAEIIGVEQGGRPPRDGKNPPSPSIEPEDAPSHFENVLLLIKQGRHRMKFFPANIQGKWTDRDAFIKIKDRYDCCKSSWWYLKSLSHVEFKKVGASKFTWSNFR